MEGEEDTRYQGTKPDSEFVLADGCDLIDWGII